MRGSSGRRYENTTGEYGDLFDDVKNYLANNPNYNLSDEPEGWRLSERMQGFQTRYIRLLSELREFAVKKSKGKWSYGQRVRNVAPEERQYLLGGLLLLLDDLRSYYSQAIDTDCATINLWLQNMESEFRFRMGLRKANYVKEFSKIKRKK